MKRFLLFAGADYYPGAGVNDLRGESDTVSELIEMVNKGNYDWWHVLDTNEGLVVFLDSYNEIKEENWQTWRRE